MKNLNTEMGLMKCLAAILFAFIVPALLLSGATPAYSMASKHTKDPCVSPARIKVGSKIFFIPRPGEIQPILLSDDELRDLCHSTQPLEVTGWTARVKLDLLLDNLGKTLSDQGYLLAHYVQRLKVFLPQDKDVRPTYEDLKKLMKLANVKLSDFPVENGFRVWKRSGRPVLKYGEYPKLSFDESYLYRQSSIYISDDPALVSPIGEPAIIACLDVENEKNCWLRIWDGEIFFEVWGMSPGLIHKEKWNEFYKGALRLRKSLLTETRNAPPP